MPNYRDVLGDKLQGGGIAACCPRCRRKGIARESEPGVLHYDCGSVFDGTLGTFREVNCTFRALTPQAALIEAATNHAFYALFPEQYELGSPNKLKIPQWTQGNADYLLWDSDVFLSVTAASEGLLGATLERGPDMKAVWIFDPAIESGERLILLSMFVFACEQGLFVGRMLQPIAQHDVPPTIMWHHKIVWGEKVKESETHLAALYTWLQQPYVVQAPSITHSRQVKREAERRQRPLPNISVIEFRRATTAGASGETKSKTLHCCFERTGFPRRQWYAKEKKHKIIWIAPTLVGDPAKLPFKPRGVPLYRVRR